MTETNSCVEKDALIDYLYGEVDADARTRVEAHLRSCEPCADEVRELTDVRGTLEAWAPPAAGLGFRVVSDAHSETAPVSFWGRLRHPPAWGLAAAAVLVLAAGAAITRPELEIGRGEMVLRLGWSDTASDVVTQPEAESASRSDQATLAAEPRQQLQPLRGTAVAVGQRSGASVPVQRGADVFGGQTAAANDERLLRSTRQLLFEKQRIADQRQADLSELQRAFGEFDRTRAEPARQQLLEVLRRVSAR
ncbi:MAG TPA: zf-HC2 domain-containing protein [Acidobacteria bacterium]|nr:zf-HC2 domain-containing protein [Acidobacteriota bacterium]